MAAIRRLTEKEIESRRNSKGEWLQDWWCGEKTRTCSVCKTSQTVNVFKGKVMFNYCPYCGADMR